MNEKPAAPKNPGIKPGCVLTIIALILTIPAGVLLVYVMPFLYPGVSGCDYPAGFYIILWCGLPGLSIILCIVGIIIALVGTVRSWKIEHMRNKIIGILVIVAALVVLVLSLASTAFWFFAFLCPG